MDGDTIDCCLCIIFIFIIFAGAAILIDNSYVPDTKNIAEESIDNDTVGTYIAGDDEYHDPSCPHAKVLVSDGEGIEYSTEEEAVKAGYKPCSICNP